MFKNNEHRKDGNLQTEYLQKSLYTKWMGLTNVYQNSESQAEMLCFHLEIWVFLRHLLQF